MKMKTLGSRFAALLLLAAALMLLSCGSSDSQSSDASSSTAGVPTVPTPPTDQEMTINAGNATAVTAMVLNTYDILSIADSGQVLLYGTGPGPSNTQSLKINAGRTLAPKNNFRAAGTGSENLSCPEGGSRSSTLQWDGPDNANGDSCLIENLQGTITFTDCAEDGQQQSGNIAFRFVGPLCNPTSMEFTYTDYSAVSQDYRFETNDLKLMTTSISWDENESFPTALPARMTVTANGRLTAVREGKTTIVAFSDYAQIDTGSTLKVYGQITGPCVDGWASLSTPTIIETAPRSCPVAGQLTIASANGTTIGASFNEDGTAAIGSQLLVCDELSALECQAP